MDNAGKDGGALPKEDWGYYEDEFGEEEPPEKDSDDFSDYEDYSSKKKKGKAKAKGKGVSATATNILCPLTSRDVASPLRLGLQGRQRGGDVLIRR